MGEGLLILNEKDNSIELINRQATNLLKLSQNPSNQFEVNKTNVGIKDLQAAIFSPKKLSMQQENGSN